ncbi:MAG: ferredoxin-thioredoxin reductase catalytic domain-containing protein [Spirochaetaceae bacterium]
MDREGISRFIRNTARHNGWEIVKDSDFLGYLEEGFLLNFQRYGYLQCPCREGWGEREKDRDILCPCTYSDEDIKEYGHCFCGLFLSPGYAEKGEPPMSIPERRPEEYFP